VLYEGAGEVYLRSWVQGFVPKFYPPWCGNIWYFAVIYGFTKKYKKTAKHQENTVFSGVGLIRFKFLKMTMFI